MRICNRCYVPKPLTEFYGARNNCKACYKQARIANLKRSKDELRKIQEERDTLKARYFDLVNLMAMKKHADALLGEHLEKL